MGKNAVIIDYGMGNTASVKKALVALGADVKISRDRKDLEEADFLILPGVGAFGDGMKNLNKFGLVDILEKQVLEKGIPFLGICLGMQLLADTSGEHGIHDGLGWIGGSVEKLEERVGIRIPHIGWNDVEITDISLLFSGIEDNCFYFVHGYAMKPKDNNVITSYCRYGEKFVSSIRKNNIYATQFHPEKSQKSGLKFLKNFLNLN